MPPLYLRKGVFLVQKTGSTTVRQGPGNVFPGQGKQRWAEGRIAELERKIGQQALEIDFLKGCLQRIEEQRMLQALTGNPPSTRRSKKK
jgi:transposase